MERNVGGTDRTMRFILGAGLVLAGFARKGWTRQLAMGAGVAVLRTAVSQRCSWNQALGIDTYHQGRQLVEA